MKREGRKQLRDTRQNNNRGRISERKWEENRNQGDRLKARSFGNGLYNKGSALERGHIYFKYVNVLTT